MQQETQDQQDPRTTATAAGGAGLLAVVVAGAAFMFALSGFCWWVATRTPKATPPTTRLLPVTDAAPTGAPAAGATLAASLPDAPPLPAEADVDQPGLLLSFAKAGADPAAGGDTRTARLVSLYVPAGTPPTPFMAAGPFAAVWEGDLNMRLRDTYLFGAQGNGKLAVTIGGQPAFEAAGDDLSKKEGEPVKLNKGKNHIVVRYESPAQGDAHVRLMWRPKDEPMPEPPGPQVWTHNAGTKAAVQGRRVREGRFLLAQLRCVRCHTTPEAQPPAGKSGENRPIPEALAAAPGRMPELAMDAPSLSDAGARLNREWVAAWVTNPRALHPDAHMPQLFLDDKVAADPSDKVKVDPRAADVAAYLATLGGNADKPAAEAPADEKVQAGGVLYTTLNCIACHTPPDAMPAPEAAGAGGEQTDADTALASKRIPHKYVRAKFTPAGLKQYLLNPHAHYAWNPMPNFRLTAEEADALAAYLLANGEEKPPVDGDVPAGDPAKGKQLVATSGCLNCHVVGADQNQAKAPALAELTKAGWARGLAKDGKFHPAGPRYGLTDEQKAAVVAFAATDRSSLGRESPPEFAERQVTAMRCIACHMRDGKESLLATTLDQEQKELEGKFMPPQPADAEAFAPDQRAPLLTWAGEKLRPEWTAAFVGGHVPYKPRPYLRARMPGFTARAVGLAQGLAEEHGDPPTSEEPGKPDAEMAAAGRKLAGKTPNQAFACVQCHAVAGAPPAAPFEAPAVNFMYARERLRKDYFHRWVRDPLKLDPNTKMPKFERDDGKTPITTAYDGDARKQFEAIWQYLLAGKDIKPPAE